MLLFSCFGLERKTWNWQEEKLSVTHEKVIENNIVKLIISAIVLALIRVKWVIFSRMSPISLAADELSGAAKPIHVKKEVEEEEEMAASEEEGIVKR